MSVRFAPLLLLAACVGGGDSASDDSASGSDCASLDEAACDARADCTDILGAPEDEVCAEDYSHWMTVWAGCMDAGMGCDDAETCGEAPDGTQLIFPSGCLPDGWTGCDYCP